jgi:TolA-binding protein
MTEPTMDCDKFESAMMDELYGDLDEVTSAAVKRHAAGCARCASLIDGFRATRRLAALPQVEAAHSLEGRILDAAFPAPRASPLRRRLARVVSMAGSWAMRPQTAMAALFLVMVGVSVPLLRGTSSRQAATATVTVTEQGTPAPAAPAPVSRPADSPMLQLASARPAEPTFAAKPRPASADDEIAMRESAPARDRSVANTPYAHAEPLKKGAGEPVATFAAPPPPPAGPYALKSARAASPVAGSAGGGMAAAESPAVGAPASPPAAAPAPAAPVAAAVAPAGQAFDSEKAEGASPFDTALAAYRARRYDDASRGFESLAATDPNSDLWAARSLREGHGCGAAAQRFDQVARRNPGTGTAWEALLEGAQCYRAVGDTANARSRLTSLLRVDSYKDRAQAELDRLSRGGP